MREPWSLAVLVAAESVFFGWLGVQLLVGTLDAGLSPPVRAVGLVVVFVELAVPIAVYVDVYRRPDDPDWVWVHAAMMPALNLLGAVAYLEDRRRSTD
jgi:hypothetical protein